MDLFDDLPEPTRTGGRSGPTDRYVYMNMPVNASQPMSSNGGGNLGNLRSRCFQWANIEIGFNQKQYTSLSIVKLLLLRLPL